MPDGPFSVLSRRRLLKLALGAGGVVAGGVGAVFTLRGSAPAVVGLKVLSPHHYRTMAALASAMFPAEAFPNLPAVDLARQFDGFLADEPPWGQDEAKQALFLLELGPLVFERRATTFSHLTPTERAEHFLRWGTSDSELRRQVFVGFKSFLSAVFYDQPEVWPAIGYEGPLIRNPGADAAPDAGAVSDEGASDAGAVSDAGVAP